MASSEATSNTPTPEEDSAGIALGTPSTTPPIPGGVLAAAMAAPISLNVEFGGGAELLFGGVKSHKVELSQQEKPWDVRQLLVWIRTNLLKERPELFIQGDNVRPGILVLINDADWELLGELDYKLVDKDTVVFISTLHGG
ncbi:unnamed protein product [Lampetra fluviatilis]